MSMLNYSQDKGSLTLNGISFENLGETDPPITIEDIEPRTHLKRGTGGKSVRLDNATRAKRVTVCLMPGCDEVRQVLALDKARVDFNGLWSQAGTLEKVALFDGVLTNRGELGRGGKTAATDEKLIFEFNDSEET